MESVTRIQQLFSDVVGACPVCDDLSHPNDDEWLQEQTNHLIQEHGWKVLHVGQESTTDRDGNLCQRTTVVLGEPAG